MLPQLAEGRAGGYAKDACDLGHWPPPLMQHITENMGNFDPAKLFSGSVDFDADPEMMKKLN